MTYHRGSKRTIQPTTTLTDQLWSRFRHIRLGLAWLDVGQGPPVTLLCDELEAQNTIFGQEHVLGEDVHSIDTLRSQAVRERMITVEILL